MSWIIGIVAFVWVIYLNVSTPEGETVSFKQLALYFIVMGTWFMMCGNTP